MTKMKEKYQLETIMLINVKMPTGVGILTFINTIRLIDNPHSKDQSQLPDHSFEICSNDLKAGKISCK